MNFDLMTSIENRGTEFIGVNYLAEIFDNPIMSVTESALDSHSEIVGWLESDFSMDLSPQSNYNNLEVKIMCLAEGLLIT